MNIVLSPPNSARTTRRMEALATLPVFFKMNGKRAVVAGGSDAAAWKAELLAAAGAIVHVYTRKPDPCLCELVRARAVVLHEIDWTPEVLEGAAIAISDAADDQEALAFFEAARSASTPVNVIDKPAYCEFQFGSIVNRSPAVVAISTDGAAPILGQAIRRRIETLLPPALAEWAALARRVRANVTEQLAAGPQRRAFWERFVDRAFGASPPASDEGLTDEVAAIAGGTKTLQGSVTFVGAGPGEAEMLTLKAVRTLQAADVILFDDRVSAEVLELARREAKRMMVGDPVSGGDCEEGGYAMVVALAKSGKHVVRLKAGNPLTAPDTEDELARLGRAGIATSVVAGVSSTTPRTDTAPAASAARGAVSAMGRT